MEIRKKVGIFILCITLLLVYVRIPLYAQTPTETPTPTPSGPTPTPDTTKEQQDLQSKIKDLQNKLTEKQGQAKTLSSQIAAMDSQVRLTELRINATKQQIIAIEGDIATATKKIDTLEESLDNLTKVLLNRIVTTYEIGNTQPFYALLSSDNISDLFSRVSYLKIVQANDKKLIFATQQAKNDYETQKTIFEDKKKKIEALKTQLEAYTKQLTIDKQNRQKLLTETRGDEANYQRLLSQAKAQLAGFQRFVTSQGGASILGNQTVCDDWGCYYNQRDGQWGRQALNGTQYTLASDGCLVTAMAMVYTHLGHRGVTPQTINSDPRNFASYYPAYLNKTIFADGTTVSRITSAIDSELSAGRPVIVGIGAGPDHFVVIISGSEGNYRMHDPFVAGGRNIPFTDHYSIASIRSIEKVVVQ